MGTLTFRENRVLKEIKQYASDGELFSFEDLVLYSDYTDFQLERILKSLNDKGLIEYSKDNKYGIIKEV
jgi:RIO-like serine/threonine protein kinase